MTGEQRGKMDQGGFSLLREGKNTLIMRFRTFTNYYIKHKYTSLPPALDFA